MDCNTPNRIQSYEGMNGLALGICYVPWQKFDQVLDSDTGLSHGSIFAELILPFYGEKAACCRTGGVYEQR